MSSPLPLSKRTAAPCGIGRGLSRAVLVPILLDEVSQLVGGRPRASRPAGAEGGGAEPQAVR